MKKKLIVLGIIFCPLLAKSAETSLLKIRSLFYQATEKVDSAYLLNEILIDSLTSTDLTLRGYKGMSLMLLSKHSYNPYKKIDYFKKGSSMLDKAIEEDKENIELRYLRYTVQYSAPMILNYRSALSADLSFIQHNVNSITDLDLKKRINNFLRQDKHVTTKLN
tara:strand:+ start:3187 stop:3678 length:492 start_codon:yes stop_codon:yes gene_type:complete